MSCSNERHRKNRQLQKGWAIEWLSALLAFADHLHARWGARCEGRRCLLSTVERASSLMMPSSWMPEHVKHDWDLLLPALAHSTNS